jgi:hypothetical protein
MENIMDKDRELTVPAFIATAWDEEGEPDSYKPIEKCTPEETRRHVFWLRDKARALQDDIVNLALYATGLDEADS